MHDCGGRRLNFNWWVLVDVAAELVRTLSSNSQDFNFSPAAYTIPRLVKTSELIHPWMICFINIRGWSFSSSTASWYQTLVVEIFSVIDAAQLIYLQRREFMSSPQFMQDTLYPADDVKAVRLVSTPRCRKATQIVKTNVWHHELPGISSRMLMIDCPEIYIRRLAIHPRPMFMFVQHSTSTKRTLHKQLEPVAVNLAADANLAHHAMHYGSSWPSRKHFQVVLLSNEAVSCRGRAGLIFESTPLVLRRKWIVREVRRHSAHKWTRADIIFFHASLYFDLHAVPTGA